MDGIFLSFYDFICQFTLESKISVTSRYMRNRFFQCIQLSLFRSVCCNGIECLLAFQFHNIIDSGRTRNFHQIAGHPLHQIIREMLHEFFQTSLFSGRDLITFYISHIVFLSPVRDIISLDESSQPCILYILPW